MAMSDSVQRNFFTSTIFVGRFAGSFENFQNKIFNISMLRFNSYPLGDAPHASGERMLEVCVQFRSQTSRLHISATVLQQTFPAVWFWYT